MSDNVGGGEQADVQAASLNDRLESIMQLTNTADYTAALDACEQTMREAPEAAEPYFLMGVIAMICQDEGQAMQMIETAHRIDPEIREYAETLGTLYTRLGRLADGLYFTKLAMGLDSHPLLGKRIPAQLTDFGSALADPRPSTHGVEAERLFNVAAFERARRECEAELRINPESKSAYVLLGRITDVLGHYERAVGAFHAAAHLDAEDAAVTAYLGRALLGLGRFTEAAATARQALRTAPGDAGVFAVSIETLLRCPDQSLDDTRRLAAEHADRLTEKFTDEMFSAPSAAASGPVRIGILSNAFFRSAATQTVNAWLTSNFDTNAYYLGYAISTARDATTTAARSRFAEWREVFDIDPFTLSLTIRGEELDVIVDLSVPDFETRLDLLAAKPAAVRVAAFALPDPGLAPGVTHILTDETLAPIDRAALRDGQELIELPGSLYACLPFEDIPQDLPAPAIVTGHVTYGGLLHFATLTPDCVALWSEILRRAKSSRLLLCSPGPIDNRARERAIELFSHFGVASQLLFPEETGPEDAPSEGGHTSPLPVAQLEAVDVFLDSLPFNGQDELAAALWAGIPVISLLGDRRLAGRGASILTAAGRVGWIAKDRVDYVRIAVGFADDRDSVLQARRRLQSSIADSNLFDVRELGQNINDALVRLALEAREKAGTDTDD